MAKNRKLSVVETVIADTLPAVIPNGWTSVDGGMVETTSPTVLIHELPDVGGKVNMAVQSTTVNTRYIKGMFADMERQADKWMREAFGRKVPVSLPMSGSWTREDDCIQAIGPDGSVYRLYAEEKVVGDRVCVNVQLYWSQGGRFVTRNPGSGKDRPCRQFVVPCDVAATKAHYTGTIKYVTGQDPVWRPMCTMYGVPGAMAVASRKV